MDSTWTAMAMSSTSTLLNTARAEAPRTSSSLKCKTLTTELGAEADGVGFAKPVSAADMVQYGVLVFRTTQLDDERRRLRVTSRPPRGPHPGDRARPDVPAGPLHPARRREQARDRRLCRRRQRHLPPESRRQHLIVYPESIPVSCTEALGALTLASIPGTCGRRRCLTPLPPLWD